MHKNVAPNVTTARVLAGAPLRDALLEQVPAALARTTVKPKLAAILVEGDPASELYVSAKMRAAADIGIAAVRHNMTPAQGEAALHALIDQLAADEAVTAILLQLPLPEGWDTDAALARIPMAKDCDGLAPHTIAQRLAGNPEATLPATPLGVMRMLKHIGQAVEGAQAVVIGQGRVAGKPMGELLAAAGAKVSLITRETPNPAEIAKQADILIAAAGVPGLVTPGWVKPGTVAIDIGLTRTDGEIRGDMDESVSSVAGWLTPVPGGVGPMTIATLLTNVADGARRASGMEPWGWSIR